MAIAIKQQGWLITGKKYIGKGRHLYQILSIIISKGEPTIIKFQDEFGVVRERTRNIFIDKFLP